MKEGGVPGLSIVVIHEGRVAWHEAYGVANAETRAPLTEDALFESASLSKPIFAYAVLKLVDAGVLSLDVPLHRYLPEPVSDERMKLITARMVLSHTTGFQNEVMPGQTLSIHFTPGSRFSYSGAGYLYLERVIEHLTNKPLDQLMRELVFAPLGMSDTTFASSDAQVYGHDAAGVVGQRRMPATPALPMLHTTPLDYARFMIANMTPRNAMLSTQTRVDPSCVMCLEKSSGKLSDTLSWGLGWALEGDAFFHWGENNGEFQHFAVGTTRGDGVVIFTNSGNGISIMPEIVEAVLGGHQSVFDWMGYKHYDARKKR